MKFAFRSPQDPQNPSADRRRYSNSGWVTPGLVGLISIGLITAAFQHGHGNLHRLTVAVGQDDSPPSLDLGPGNQSPLRLTRSATDIGKNVEFLSATLLPGRGMNVFQITAMIPGHGEVPLLISPSLTDASTILSGKGSDTFGEASTSLGGAIELPWAGFLTGNRAAAPNMLQTSWNGNTLSFPTSTAETSQSVEGLFLTSPSNAVKSDVMPDGQYAEAFFHEGNFAGSWPSTVDVLVRAELSAHTLDLTLTARNTGNQPTPFGIGWHPFFSIPSGDRNNALLTVPSNTEYEFNHRTGLPTGKTISTNNTPMDFSSIRGTKLGSVSLNETYTHLQTALLNAQPVVELRDPAFNLSLRVIPMSPNIRNLRIIAPAGKPWISIGPNTNVSDAFGPEWQSPQDAGIVIIPPGESMQWKVRIEISPLGSTDVFAR